MRDGVATEDWLENKIKADGNRPAIDGNISPDFRFPFSTRQTRLVGIVE